MQPSFDAELYKTIQLAVLDVAVAEQRCATHKDIAVYVERRYGKRWKGDGTVGRRVRELVQEGLLRRRAPGIFALTDSQVIDGGVKMKVKELVKGKVASIVGELAEIGEEKRPPNGGDKFREAMFRDESGKVKMTLWGEDADRFHNGQVVELKNGWCKEFDGALQLSAGKFGELMVSAAAAKKEDTFPLGPPPEPGQQKVQVLKTEIQNCPKCHAAFKVTLEAV